MICNDSGTYAPNEQSLQLMKELLNQVFPDLKVELKVFKEEPEEVAK